MKTLNSLLFTALLILIITPSFAFESNSSDPDENAPKSEEAVYEMPSFVGGYQALSEYMNENLSYPEYELEKGIEGTVVVEYFINERGQISNIKIAESVTQGLDAEAIRLVADMPRWNPATFNEAPYRIKYRLPITFDLTF